jgi:hypothetical protein
MPQLSLYLDSETLGLVEEGARSRELSLSKYVASVLKEHVANDWPESIFGLFGSIDDDSFDAPAELSFADDLKRAEL